MRRVLILLPAVLWAQTPTPTTSPAQPAQSRQFLDRPSDPMMFGAAAAVLSLVGLFACWLPARRAAALDPANAIRNQ
jgi:ABC-type lipoprotein release transport system permease subunit